MAVSFQPYAFAAPAFEAGLAADGDMISLLVESTLDEPAFDWSLDGSEETEIICERVDDDGATIGSLVDVVRARLSDDDEARLLLGFVSARAGRLVGQGAYVGFLLPEEARRLATLLGGMIFTEPAEERDRLLLLGILGRLEGGSLGVYWMAR
jgi:hypothetical protein